MTTTRKVFASLLTLLAVCFVQAADSKPIARVTTITDVETDDPTAFASWIDKRNEIVKAKLGIDTYQHVYVSNYDGVKTSSVRLVTVSDSVSTIAKNNAALAGNADLRASPNPPPPCTNPAGPGPNQGGPSG